MANKAPDIRILVGNKGGASTSGESAVLIRTNLEKALAAGIKIKVDVDKSQLGALKKQVQGITSGIKIGIGTSSGNSSGKLPTDKDVATQVKLNKALADASLRLSQFNNYLQTVNPKGLKEYAVQIAAIRNGLASRDPLKIKSATAGVNELKAAFKTAGYEGGNVFTYLGAKVKTFATYLLSSALTMGVINGVRNIISTVKELDSSLTNLRIVTGGTRAETQKLLSTYNQMASELGSTTAKVADSAVEWQRQGYSISDTNTLIKDSMVLSIVGFIDEKEAATALTAAMKGYQLSVDEAMSVVDKFTATDMVAASSAGTLAEALSKTAANAKLAGLSLDDVIAQLAVVNETMQEDGSQTGTFYNTMLSRMGALKSGRLSDPETSDDLSDVEATLGGLGIKLRDSQSEFRNFGDVLDDVGGKWESFSSVQQRAIATAFAGTRQQTRFLSLMSGWGRAQEYAEIAAGSAGTALEKFSVYEESVEAKTNRMTSAFEKFSTTLLDSGLIGSALDLGTAIFNAGAAFDAWPAKLLLAATAVTGLVAAFKALQVSTIGAAFKNTLNIIPNLLNNLNALGTVTTLAATNVKMLGASFSSMTSAQIVNTAVSKGMSKEQLIVALSYSTLDVETKKSIKSQFADAAARTVNTGAGAGQTAGNGVLALSFKAITAAIWENIKAMLKWLTTTPAGWCTLAVIAIGTVIATVSALTVTYDEALKKQQALQDEVNRIESDISGFNGELSTTRQRLEELEAKKKSGPLNILEQEEYDRLKAYNEELERQIRNEETLLKLARQDAMAAFVETADKFSATYGLDSFPTFEDTYNFTETKDARSATEESLKQYSYYSNQLLSAQESMAAAQSSLRAAASEEEKRNAQSIIDSLSKDIERLTDLRTFYEKVSRDAFTQAAETIKGQSYIANPTTDLDKENNKWLDYCNDIIDAFNVAFGEVGAKEAAFTRIINKEQFSQAKKSLEGLGTTGKVTAAELASPKYAELVGQMDSVGISVEDLVGLFNSLKSEGSSLTQELEGIQSALAKISSSKSILDDVLGDIEGNGKITLGTLEDIIEKYDDLEGAVALYTAGVLDSADILDLVQDKYDQDIENYGKLVVAKNQLNNTYYSGLLKSNNEWVKKFADKYGVDLKNYKSLAEAKLAIEKQLLGNVTSAWKTFYNAQTNGLTDAAGHAAMKASRGNYIEGVGWDWSGPKTEEDRRILADIQAITRYQQAIAELDNISLDFSTSNINFEGSSSKSKKAIDLYIAEIDALYESTKRLNDIRNRMDTIEARSSQLDVEDYRQKNEYVKETIQLRQQENDVLNEQNNIRRQLIQTGVDKLRGQGFIVDYDAASNHLLIRNMEKLNTLSGGSIELTNKLRKETEALIDDVEKLNNDAIGASLNWHKNSAQNIEDAKSLAENIKAAADAYLQDSDHEFGLMERHGATDAELIAKLNEQKAAVHEFAEEIRRELSPFLSSDVIESLDVVQGLSAKWFDIDDKIKDIYKEQLDNLEDLVDLTRDMIKQEKEDLIDALEAQKDA